jgi:hypothetical protein
MYDEHWEANGPSRSPVNNVHGIATDMTYAIETNVKIGTSRISRFRYTQWIMKFDKTHTHTHNTYKVYFHISNQEMDVPTSIWCKRSLVLKPKCSWHAPGLQKQPVRMWIWCSAASVLNSEYPTKDLPCAVAVVVIVSIHYATYHNCTYTQQPYTYSRSIAMSVSASITHIQTTTTTSITVVLPIGPQEITRHNRSWDDTFMVITVNFTDARTIHMA